VDYGLVKSLILFYRKFFLLINKYYIVVKNFGPGNKVFLR